MYIKFSGVNSKHGMYWCKNTSSFVLTTVSNTLHLYYYYLPLLIFVTFGSFVSGLYFVSDFINEKKGNPVVYPCPKYIP